MKETSSPGSPVLWAGASIEAIRKQVPLLNHRVAYIKSVLNCQTKKPESGDAHRLIRERLILALP